MCGLASTQVSLASFPEAKFSFRCLALSRFNSTPSTSLLFSIIYRMMALASLATYRDERALLLHELLTHEIQLTACLSPAGYLTVFLDRCQLLTAATNL
jgi:hypothetical protein